MKIEPHQIPVREIVEGYQDNEEGGVVGYGGKLNIRPAYQREFVYDDAKRNAVIETLRHGFPLNVMYWVHNAAGGFELLDGQQRTLSICQYVHGDFSMPDGKYFKNLPPDLRQQILDYELTVYICEGTDSERLDWFRVINTAGERLTPQELLNANYTGPWLADAKLHFSKTKCPAYKIADKYMAGKPIRQDYLETVLGWLNDGDGRGYMAAHQHDDNANELWLYFQQVIHWVETLFPKYRSEMKGVAWGELFNKVGTRAFDAKKLEKRVTALMEDDDVTAKKGIYPYVLTGAEKFLNIRVFTAAMKRSAYEKQKGICAKCGKHFDLSEMEADHVTPWSKGGKTAAANCQMLCLPCNRAKSDL